jgi:hypothetical protein
MRPGEEHQAAKKALRRGNARRRSYILLCCAKMISFCVSCFGQCCRYFTSNNAYMVTETINGEPPAFRGEKQKFFPLIVSGDYRLCSVSGPGSFSDRDDLGWN